MHGTSLIMYEKCLAGHCGLINLKYCRGYHDHKLFYHSNIEGETTLNQIQEL